MINIASRAYNRPEHGANVSAHAQEHSLTDTYYHSYKTRNYVDPMNSIKFHRTLRWCHVHAEVAEFYGEN